MKSLRMAITGDGGHCTYYDGGQHCFEPEMGSLNKGAFLGGFIKQELTSIST